MRQVKIFQDSSARKVEEDVNDWIGDAMTANVNLNPEITISTSAAGPAEDQFVITTVMIVFDE